MATAIADPYVITPLGVHLAVPYTAHYPHVPQETFLAVDAVEAFYGGAAGPGKSDALLMAALQYVHVPGYSALLLRRTYPELAMPGGLMHRAKLWLAGTDAKWSAAGGDEPYTWRFPSGARLVFGHAETETAILRYYGSEWQFIGWDELTAFPEAWYRLLFSRLRKPVDGPLAAVPLRMRSASNPGGRGHEWVKRRFIDKQPDPDDPNDTPEKCRRRIFIRARLRDNPSIDQEAYLRSLSELEPEVRAQLLDGDWDARQPGDWYFDERHLSAVAELGRELEDLLAKGELPPPAGGVLPLGIDTGENWHTVLGWPLELGGMFIVREYVGTGSEPIDSTNRSLALNTFELPFGRARYDAAGVQSMRTFKRVVRERMPYPQCEPSKVAFSKHKGEAAMYLRRLARRTFEGRGVQVLAVSPRCPVFLRQLRLLERDLEAPTGAWRKDEDQHGPDAGIALVAPLGKRFRAQVEGRPAEREAALT